VVDGHQPGPGAGLFAGVEEVGGPALGAGAGEEDLRAVWGGDRGQLGLGRTARARQDRCPERLGAAGGATGVLTWCWWA